MGRPIHRVVALLLLLSPLAAQEAAAGVKDRGEFLRFVTSAVPDSLPDPVDPALFAPTSAARLQLGRRLFFDTLLSRDRSLSCASCHQPDHGFADPRPTSVGIGGSVLARNAPTLFNRYLGRSFTWDGRFTTLETQVVQPIRNEHEMALGTDAAVERLRASVGYRELFAKAWPGHTIDEKALAGSLAHFVRHIRIGDSPIDVWRFDRSIALTPLEKRGLALSESRANCWHCHLGPDFTDEWYHDTGIGVVRGVPQPGRFAVTGDEDDRGRFKTPTLRGLTYTAPYMHDGSLKTLRDVVLFYRRGGNPNQSLDPILHPLRLSERDVDALVAFLEALSR